MYDLVIRAGSVVDGTGVPAVTADVGIRDGRIVEIGRISSATRRTIDADGLLVTPGFVDIHTHYDGQATWDPYLTPSCWHGVTTAIMGNCGVGFAPVRPAGHQALVELMEGVEDIPGSALAEGIRWNWESFPEYLDALDSMPRVMDIGCHVPHAALRAYVMGERALANATGQDIEALCSLLRASLEAGAVGFSTGRTVGHRDSRGNAVPGTFAAEDELAALLAVMDDLGRGVFQVVPAGVGGEMTGDAAGAMEAELDWLVRRGEASRRPLTFLVMERAEINHWRPWFEAVRAANARGANLRPQVGNRCFGVLMGHQSRLNPFQYRASYRALAHLPLPERVARLRDPQVRAAILADAPDYSGPFAMDQLGRRGFDNLYPLGNDLNYEPRREDSVRALAQRQGIDPWELAYDLMLEDGGREFLLLPLLNYGEGSYDGLLDMMRDPSTVHGLGDGGAHVGLICDASMTTYMLCHWARDRSRGARLSVEHAVRRLTADPAELYGLADRGVIAVGKKADLNLIEFGALRLRRPEQVYDLPTGAGRLIQRADGYVATIVSGMPTLENGAFTDALPGRLLRGASGPGR
ncbi:MAG: amidohydrolase family protein [Halioglobus sp.]